MDPFAAIILGGVLLLVLFILAIGFSASSVHTGQLINRNPAHRHEGEAEVETEDVDQMLEAQNERRRRSGRPELAYDEFENQVVAKPPPLPRTGRSQIRQP